MLRLVSRRPIAVGLIAGGLTALTSQAALGADPYVIGLSADLLGPASGSYKPMAEGVRIYVEALNKRGGINGHPVKLLVRDNRSNPRLVIGDLKYFDNAKAVGVVFVAPSGTIGAYAQHSARIKMPTIYTNACYPPATPPSPAPHFFCPGANALTESIGAVRLLFKLYKGPKPMKLAIITSNIPGARAAAEKIMKPTAMKMGAKVIDVAVMPLGSTDATPIARSFKARGVTAVLTYTLASHMLAGADALAKVGWKGQYLMATSVPGVIFQMRTQLRSPNAYSFDQFSLLSENKPVHQKIKQAIKAHGFKFPPNDARWGWRNGIVLEAALRKCGWPCDRKKLLGAMGNLKVDNRDLLDLQGTPVVWNASVHTSPMKGYRIYKYSGSKKDLVLVNDWVKLKEVPWGGRKKKK